MSKHRNKHKVYPKPKKERKPLRFTLGQLILAIFITALVMTVAALVYKLNELTKSPRATMIERIEDKEQAEIKRIQKKWKETEKTAAPERTKMLKAIEKKEQEKNERIQKLWNERRK